MKASISDLLRDISSRGHLVEREEYYSTETSGGVTILQGQNVSGSPRILGAGKGNILVRGSDSKLEKSSISFGGSNCLVFLGANTNISEISLRLLGDASVFIFGAFSTVVSMTAMVRKKVTIGDFCMLSSRIVVEDSDHHAIYSAETGRRINEDRPVTIGNHVWIGRDVRIGKGANIGSDTVIAQCSVVVGAVDSGCVYGGTPARRIKSGIKWSRMSANTWEEMEASERHKSFLQKVERLKERSILGGGGPD